MRHAQRRTRSTRTSCFSLSAKCSAASALSFSLSAASSAFVASSSSLAARSSSLSPAPASPLGSARGAGAGGWLGAWFAERSGWRTGFYCFGGAGMALALALYFFLRQ